MTNKLLTVEEIIKSELNGDRLTPIQWSGILRMINKAQSQAVDHALEVAAENALVHNGHHQGCAWDSDDFTVDKDSILNSADQIKKGLGIIK